MSLQSIEVDDIIKLSREDESTMGKVTDVTDTAVAIFRDTGDVWYSFDEWDVEFLGVAD